MKIIKKIIGIGEKRRKKKEREIIMEKKSEMEVKIEKKIRNV